MNVVVPVSLRANDHKAKRLLEEKVFLHSQEKDLIFRMVDYQSIRHKTIKVLPHGIEKFILSYLFLLGGLL